jgi:hypothetical protein
MPQMKDHRPQWVFKFEEDTMFCMTCLRSFSGADMAELSRRFDMGSLSLWPSSDNNGKCVWSLVAPGLHKYGMPTR